jgi:serine-protein kinase ATM
LQVIEFVDGTVSFGSFVVGSNHKAYFPNEWSSDLCSKHYEKVHRQGKSCSLKDMRENLEEIFKRFSPSYRFFFIESFGHNMESWHQAKMNFTRSVAVSSIVGHILGIGDRHTSNILVHKGSGECLHIDFGIVFEQGKVCAVCMMTCSA